MKLKKLSLQEYLSLGYIYLVVLGIFSDVIYYKFLGIDILNYSTILDVLITPINIMVHDLRVPFYFLLTAAVAYFYFTIFLPKFHFKFRDKKWYKRLNNVEKLDKKYSNPKDKKGLLLVPFLVLSMFLGFGMGRGSKMKSRIKEGDIKASHKITFEDKESVQVKIIGQNNSFIFYVKENEKEVSISPITQNIKEIIKIDSK